MLTSSTIPWVLPAYLNAAIFSLNHGDIITSIGSDKAADLTQMAFDTKSIRPFFASEIHLETSCAILALMYAKSGLGIALAQV